MNHPNALNNSMFVYGPVWVCILIIYFIPIGIIIHIRHHISYLNDIYYNYVQTIYVEATSYDKYITGLHIDIFIPML
jgi:hypothetical protein